ncbi:MAG: hypothetical protein IPP71_07610 [Bacteroidetes bacterium]|nr:hypothetical protein [Bacteroidota bacterium]
MINKKVMFQVLLLLLVASISKSQDTIIKINNTRIIAKVLEINMRDIKYKKFINLEGPIYVIDRKHVSRIIYANGTADTISNKTVYGIPENVKSDPRVKDYGRNLLSATISDVFFGFATLGYEHILKTGKIGIKIPLSKGFKDIHISTTTQNYQNSYYYNDGWDVSGYYNRNKIFSTGLDFYYYTGGQGTWRYFVGPCIEYGQFYYKYYELISYSPTTYKLKKGIGNYGAIIFKNGMLFQPSKNFNVSINIGAGFYQGQTKNGNSEQFTFFNFEDFFAVEFGLNVGYKF